MCTATSTSAVDFAALLDTGDEPVSYFAIMPGAPSRATILRAIARGELDAVFVGKEYRITEQAFAAWLRARRVPAAEHLNNE
ncbi:helix-turn-helix domain-containing protein [Gordonia jacobaea]|uniref:helix-turn-helix domain-containing protein n=1 Tax=Gordonia jacobaea TaxID=122202 RepID=UPI0022E00DB0|nr:helix-turn-helix domain-containing protein [Gordonia jacobaea]